MEYYVCIDFGGTNTKVILYTAQGRLYKNCSFKTDAINLGSGRREIDLIDLKNKIMDALSSLVDSIDEAGKITGIICIGHGKGLYVLDDNREIFTNGILSIDERGIDIAAALEQDSKSIWSISYQHIMPSQAPVLLKWLKDNDRSVYDRIGYVLSAKDFIRFLLTGEIQQEIGDASGNNLINLNKKRYDQKLLEYFDILEMESCLPPLVSFKDICGEITSQVSRITGIPEGTPVIGGFFDIDACTLGAGVIDERYLNVVAGTWNINVLVSNTPSINHPGIMNSIYLDNKYLIEASSPTSAGNLDTFLQIIENKKIDYERINVMVSDSKSKSNVLFYPFLYGTQKVSKGSGAFIGLKKGNTLGQMYRSVYEGVAFAHKYHIEELRKVCKDLPQKLRISGGIVNSEVWLQIFADVLQMEIEVIDEIELGCLGGVIALNAVFDKDQIEPEYIEKFIKVKKTIMPSTNQQYYQNKYKVYLKGIELLEPLWALCDQ